MSGKTVNKPPVTLEDLRSAAKTVLNLLAQPIAVERHERRDLAIVEALLEGVSSGSLIVVDASKITVESSDESPTE